MTPGEIPRVESVRLLHVALALSLGGDWLARDRALECVEAGKKRCRKIGARGGWTSSYFRHQQSVSKYVLHCCSTAFKAISTPSSIWVAAIAISRPPNLSASG